MVEAIRDGMKRGSAMALLETVREDWQRTKALAMAHKEAWRRRGRVREVLDWLTIVAAALTALSTQFGTAALTTAGALLTVVTKGAEKVGRFGPAKIQELRDVEARLSHRLDALTELVGELDDYLEDNAGDLDELKIRREKLALEVRQISSGHLIAHERHERRALQALSNNFVDRVWRTRSGLRA